MTLVLKVACPSCGFEQDTQIGTEVRCEHCGNDYRALGHGESSTRIVSVTPDELEHVPYSQRSTEVPRSSASSLIISDPELLDDKLLRDLPMKDNARWCGRVRLIKKIGAGGMGAVYRGFDESLALDVAVKILPVPPGGKEVHFADRFRMEARISAQINSANVVRTRDVGESGSVVYLVMDFIEGQTARQLLDRKGFIPVPHALQIVHDAALGMQAAHERGIVHRDVKPENILVANDGRVLLADLGLAKVAGSRITDSLMPITRMGLLLGTPEYMSPEQWDIGAHITPRSDIWSMGVTLWVMLTRRSPFEDSDLGTLSKKIKEATLPDIFTIRPDVPPKVASILYHCMAKNPQRRYMNAAALVNALSQAMLHPDQADDEFSTPPLTPSSLSISTSKDSLQVARSANVAPPKPVAPILNTPIAAKTQQPGVALPPSLAAAAKAAPGSKITASPNVTPIKPAVAPYVEPPRAMPTPILAPAKPKTKSEFPSRNNNKKKRTVTRTLVWIALPAAAACAAFAIYRYSPLLGSIVNPDTGQQAQAPLHPAQPAEAVKAPRVDAPEAALDVNFPERVKIGEKRVLTATLKNVDDPAKYKIVWQSGKDEPQTGADLSALFENDRDFDVHAIQVGTEKEVAHKHFTVLVDLAVAAVEVASQDENSTRLEGSVGGGPKSADQLELRWFESKNPNEILSNKLSFDLSLKDVPPGQRTFVCQARRKGERDWKGASSDKVAVVIQARVPAEYTKAMKDAAQFMKQAENADSGSAALALYGEATKLFEKAQGILPGNSDALTQKGECMRRAKAEDQYVTLLNEGRLLAYTAEQEPLSEPYKKQPKVEAALKPFREARSTLQLADLRVHAEVQTEIQRLEEVVTVCKKEIDGDIKAQEEFAAQLKKARESVKEAEKYQSLAVALPYWDQAWNTFDSMRKKYPKLTMNDGFELESKHAQEKYLDAFCWVKAGFLPKRPEDTIYQKQPKPNVVQPVRNGQTMTPTNKSSGQLIEDK